MLIASSPAAGQNRFTIPANTFKVGDVLKITATGHMSCAVTTPGTFRFDVRFGSTVVFDTTAIPLNIVAQTTVPWWVEIMLTIRSIGALWGYGGREELEQAGADAIAATPGDVPRLLISQY